jgi:hypothetical protein
MQAGQEATVIMDSAACHIIRRRAIIKKILNGGRSVLVDIKRSKTKRTIWDSVVVRADQIALCWKCGNPAVERYKGKDWCNSCFENDMDKITAENKPRLEDFLRNRSSLADISDKMPSIDGIDAARLNIDMTKKMKERGIPTLDPRDPRSRSIAP